MLYKIMTFVKSYLHLSYRWRQQQERVEKLNMQAAVSATLQEDEFVKEFLASYEKVCLAAIQVSRNAFFKFDTHPSPRNANNVGSCILVTNQS